DIVVCGQGITNSAEAFEEAIRIDLSVRADARSSGGNDGGDGEAGLVAYAALPVPPVGAVVHDVAVQGAVGRVRPEPLAHAVRIEMGMDIAEARQQQFRRTGLSGRGDRIDPAISDLDVNCSVIVAAG